MIKAIETRYKGYRFRSRLEARWAVFFDNLGLNWKYEAQGFASGDGAYLPDFEVLSDSGNTFFVEVKGSTQALQSEWERYSELLDFGGCLPEFGESREHKKTGLIILGDIPDGTKIGCYFHPIITHWKGLHQQWCSFTPEGVVNHGESMLADLCNLHEADNIQGDPDKWVVETRFLKLPIYIPRVSKAYIAARSARFEHGECGL